MPLYIFLGIFMFGILIFIHELGHFIAAKKCGVGIYEFSIGMGPKILSRKGKDGVLYSLRLLPIGGFVAMHGEDDDENFENSETSLSKKPIWQRFIVISAGAFMNLLLGFIICFFLVIFGSDISSTVIDEFVFSDAEGIVEFQGIKVGDEIKKVGDRKINIWHDFVYELMNLPGKKVDITVKRDGEEVIVKDFKVPHFTDPKTGIEFGASQFIIPKTLQKNPSTVLKQTFYQPISTVIVTWDALIQTIKGRYGTKALSGPVGVVSEMKEIKETGGTPSLVFLMMLITINLGVMNLLPLPALDGGRLFLLLIEAIRRKPLKPNVEAVINGIGLALLLTLMLFVTFNDIIKLF